MLNEKPIPKQTLSIWDAIALIVGVVIGTGIFKTPSLIAANTGKDTVFLLAWLAGELVSLIGALLLVGALLLLVARHRPRERKIYR